MSNKNNFKKISVILLTVFFIFNTVSYAGDSIVADFANKTFNISLTDGSSIFHHDNEDREKYNNQILQETSNINISLFDRFGGNLKFIPYFGEKKFNLSVADSIYSNMKENNNEFSISPKDIFNKSDAQVNNEVYEGRPDILSDENVAAGMTDPRQSAYSSVSDSGGQAAVGNMYLGMSNIITEFVTYLAGGGILKDIGKFWGMIIKSGVYEYITNMIMQFFPLIVLLFVFMLFRSIMNIVNGSESIGKIMIKVLNFTISLGIVYAMVTNPNVIKSISDLVIIETDNLFTNIIAKDANEVSRSDDNKHILYATIWSKTVLDPWSKGMFDGLKYDELYTQHSDKRKIKMDQSNDNIMTEWSSDSLRYGSATLTGDVKIPLGNGRNIQNWAALAWSTQSIYHIDSVESESEEVDDDLTIGESFYAWPKAELTPNNNQIYIDNFRWLDAKLNISPGYISPEEHNGNYDKSKTYKNEFIKYGIESIILSLLLFPFIGPIFRKLIVMIQIVISSIRWMYMSIMSIVKPNDNNYSNLSNIKNILMPLYIYLWWSMTIYIMFYFYEVLVGDLLGNIIWLILSYSISKFKPITSTKTLRRMQRETKNVFNNIRRKYS